MRAEAFVRRRGFVRTALLAAAASQSFLEPQKAVAWCGERFPSWAYYLKWDQVDVPFEYDGKPAGTVSYRVVGDKARETGSAVPPVLVCGTPGFGYDYLENMEALTVSDRRVIEVTFASSAPIESGAAQLAAVCRALGVPVVHVVAHGLGAVPALNLVGASGAGSIRSLTLISPYGALSDLRDEARADILSTPGRSPPPPPPSPPPPPPPPPPTAYSFPGAKDCSALKTEAGRTYCEKQNAAKAPPPVVSTPPMAAAKQFGLAALLPTVSGNARASCIAEAQGGGPGSPRGGAGAALVLSPLLSQAPSQEALRLGGDSLGRRLAEEMPKAVPVMLITGGDADIVRPDGWSNLPPSLKRIAYPSSGHLPFIEARDDALGAVLEFLDTADGKETNREFKFADPITTVKELL
jgi:pimeloyl-ACP methyl ester carboxylesterase